MHNLTAFYSKCSVILKWFVPNSIYMPNSHVSVANRRIWKCWILQCWYSDSSSNSPFYWFTFWPKWKFWPFKKLNMSRHFEKIHLICIFDLPTNSQKWAVSVIKLLVLHLIDQVHIWVTVQFTRIDCTTWMYKSTVEEVLYYVHIKGIRL